MLNDSYSLTSLYKKVTFAQNRGASGLILFPGSQNFQGQQHESWVLDDDPARPLSMATTTSADASVGADPLTPYSVLGIISEHIY